MTNEKAIVYRNKIDTLENEVKKERDRFKKAKPNEKDEIKKKIDSLEKDIDKTYESLFKEFDEDIELKSIDEMNEQSILFSEFFGRYLVRLDLSTSQIRNVYGDVMRLKMKGFSSNELMLLKPRLAYTTERKGTDGSRKFREKIENALDKVIFIEDKSKQETLFQNFANFFEAILAYHRSFGGK
ncbi:Csm2 family CRISPR-associated protein [Ignavibacterium album JCM 16511]|uniref:CRISPR system Cms protein Csm2 n=1 Tax=Ignavibacterium album (strain DSM 19864 / JCM 16511 / NBRC 101810 / Mat9-16) TaxID=945713 RepID=I0AIU8_IGNAJ|nr:type III-A CRISPR-associated protein Csm2 [Ignavibacterium album]AFH48905.1 Csm2 family CRISPR-associated protein [Ignavibacterium album JCM 16511]